MATQWLNSNLPCGGNVDNAIGMQLNWRCSCASCKEKMEMHIEECTTCFLVMKELEVKDARA